MNGWAWALIGGLIVLGVPGGVIAAVGQRLRRKRVRGRHERPRGDA